MKKLAEFVEPEFLQGRESASSQDCCMAVWGDCVIVADLSRQNLGHPDPRVSLLHCDNASGIIVEKMHWDLAELVPEYRFHFNIRHMCVVGDSLWMLAVGSQREVVLVAFDLSAAIQNSDSPPNIQTTTPFPANTLVRDIFPVAPFLGLRLRIQMQDVVKLVHGSGREIGRDSATMSHPYPGGAHEFGANVCALSSGILVAAEKDGTVAFDAGAAYQFDLVNNGAPQLAHSYFPDPPFAGARFGTTLAAGKSFVAIGAPRQSTGCVYLFGYANGGAGKLLKILGSRDPGGVRNPNHGFSMAADDSTLVVGQTIGSNPRVGGTAIRYDTDVGSPSFGGILEQYELPADWNNGMGIFLNDSRTAVQLMDRRTLALLEVRNGIMKNGARGPICWRVELLGLA